MHCGGTTSLRVNVLPKTFFHIELDYTFALCAGGVLQVIREEERSDTVPVGFQHWKRSFIIVSTDVCDCMRTNVSVCMKLLYMCCVGVHDSMSMYVHVCTTEAPKRGAHSCRANTERSRAKDDIYDLSHSATCFPNKTKKKKGHLNATSAPVHHHPPTIKQKMKTRIQHPQYVWAFPIYAHVNIHKEELLNPDNCLEEEKYNSLILALRLPTWSQMIHVQLS